MHIIEAFQKYFLFISKIFSLCEYKEYPQFFTISPNGAPIETESYSLFSFVA